jgi:hypothetical protein
MPANSESRPISTAVRPAWYLLALIAAVIAISSKGMLSEGTIIMGDMPRHMMNGVFLFDALRDLPSDPMTYAYHYFARYPALSLGHHPLILPLAEVPAFALVGISIFSSRLVIIGFMLIAVVFWFRLIHSLYDHHVAFFSSLLFITSHMVVRYSRVTMSEISALAFLMMTLYFFHKFTLTRRIPDIVLCIICLALSLYAKLILVFLIPLFAGWLLIEKPFRNPSRKAFGFLAAAIILLLLVPLVILTASMAKGNIIWVFQHPGQNLSLDWLFAYLKVLWRLQLAPPVLFLSLFGLLMTLVKRGKRGLFFMIWILLLYLELLVIGPADGRYSIYWIPPFCLFAALVPKLFGTKFLRIGLLIILMGASGYQAHLAAQMTPEYIEGYEEAARFVVDAKAGTVLYSASFDSGYFVFFVRKYDADKRMIVLLSDKILATSMLGSVIEDKISDALQIHSTLQDFGIRYVVIEDRESSSKALELLREEARKEKFILIKTIPIKSNLPELNGVNLLVYEYNDWKYADPKAEIRMNIPLMGKEISVRLSDLKK